MEQRRYTTSRLVKDDVAIVLEDSSTLHDLCGVNDRNLRYIEGVFGSRVHTRGNQLYLDSSRDGDQIMFRELIGELQTHLKNGHTPDRDLIQGVYRSLLAGESAELSLLRESVIAVPGGNTKVFPRGFNQAAYIESMSKKDIVFGVGPAGTGKTFLAIAYALQEILSKRMRKLVLTRPVVEAGESLGFLPGDLAQKINPYLRPLYDAMDILVPYETVNRLEENRIIEIAPLAYMRGRSISNAFIILDEAQNTTVEQMKMFLTRMGEGSKIIITGDITQIDLPSKKKSGLVDAVNILSGIDEISFSYFTAHDVVRHQVVKKIIQAYETQS
jgi:phosphate starvation-inducible PhoH-like protein